MISSSLIVIGLIMAILFAWLLRYDRAEIESDGQTMARMLSAIPTATLVERAAPRGTLDVFSTGRADTRHAYTLVTGSDGKVIAATSVAGVDIPLDSVPLRPESWEGSRELTLPENGRDIVEYHAPLLAGGEITGTVRVGFFRPGVAQARSQLPLLALLALPVFLLTPVFYLLVRREIRPLRQASRQMGELLGKTPQEAAERGEMGEFVQQFNTFRAQTLEKIDLLQSENDQLVTAQKLVSYGRSRIERVLDALPQGVLIIDPEGRVTHANSRLESMLGVAPDTIINQPPSAWCAHPEALEFLSRFEDRSSRSFLSETIRLNPSDTSDRKLALRAYPLGDGAANDADPSHLVVISDVTREVQAEDGRANFVAHVAHELKSPLNTLGLYAEALQGKDGDDKKFRTEAINVIHDEVERLAALVDNLLNITKIESGSVRIEKKRTRLKDFIEDAYNNLAARGKANDIECILDLPEALSPVNVDKELLRIAVNNLLVNAIKYSDAGDKVWLTASEDDECIRISVRDEGIGIGEEDQAKIFDRFYRAEGEATTNRSGHGLGLTLARDIVEMHRGQLTLTSELGKGSEFVIELFKEAGMVRQAI
jgi:signal transduction histidine kinase